MLRIHFSKQNYAMNIFLKKKCNNKQVDEWADIECLFPLQFLFLYHERLEIINSKRLS